MQNEVYFEVYCGLSYTFLSRHLALVLVSSICTFI